MLMPLAGAEPPVEPSLRRLLCVALIVACGCEAGDDGAEPAYAAQSSSIVLSEDGASLWVASPDDDAVVQIGTRDLEEIDRVVIDGAPESLARAGDRIVVALAQSTDVAVLDERGAVARLPLPCGGTGAVVASAAGTVWVACPNDDTLVEIDPREPAVLRTLASPGRPTALAFAGEKLAVTATRSGTLSVLDATTGAVVESLELERSPGFAATHVEGVAPFGDDAFVATFERVDHDSDRERPPERGGYGSVIDGNPRIEPRVAGARCGPRYARFDGGPRVLSGPSAIAHDVRRDRLVIAHRTTDSVAVLDCRPAGAGRELAPLVATYRVGRGPRGVAIDRDGAFAFVDVAFDHAIARLDLAASVDRDAAGEPRAAVDAALVRRREIGPTARFDEQGLRGRAIFADAVNTHLTPSGIVTCATCHPGGGDDGLRWFLHAPQVGPKLRRTPPAWSARASLAPFHWDGEFTDAATLTRATIRGLMGGDALLVDAEAVAAYLDQTPAPPPRPLSGADVARAARGRELFESSEVGCATCHAGSATSDVTLHRGVVAPSSDADGVLDAVDTPSLRGVRARAPYLHDGRAPTLLDVLTTHNPDDTHGHTSQLSTEDLDALVLHLQTF